jgi:hypothetical protein
MVLEIQQRIVSASNLEFRGLERNKCLLPPSQRELARKTIPSATHRRFVKALSSAILFAVALGAPATTIAAPTSCAPRAELLAQLSKRFSEAPIAAGLANGGALIELLTSGDGSTWTIIVSQPEGPSCIVAVGESWQTLKRVAGEMGS